MIDPRESKHARRAPGIALIVAVTVALTAATGVALAQSPPSHRSLASQPTAAVQPEPVAAADSASNEPQGLRSNLGELPFTGLDLLILGGLAMVLLGTGMALRRLSAPRV